MKKRRKYQKELPRLMYSYFCSYKDAGAPSFSKFAMSMGMTLADIEAFRANKEFERAYTECVEIRRDYLIDNALSKRFDSSFAKFILSEELGARRDSPDGELEISLKVISEENEAPS